MDLQINQGVTWAPSSLPSALLSISSLLRHLYTLLSHRNLLAGNQGHQLLAPLCDFSPYVTSPTITTLASH